MRPVAALQRFHIHSKPELLRAGCFIMALWGSVFAGVLVLLELPRLVAVSLGATAAFVAIGWTQGRTQSTRITANLLALTAYASVTLIAYSFREDPFSPWFLVVPLVATMVGSLGSGAAWAGLVAIQSAVPRPIEALVGLSRPVPIPEETARLLELSGFVGALLCVLSLVTVYELFRRQALAGVRAKNRALAQALDEVKWLQGILPICMHCRRVRDERASWQRLEEYLDSHSRLRFSHGLCETCLKRHYPEETRKDPS